MSRQFIKNQLLIFVVTVVLLWPAFYNGQPIFFSDTTAYIRGADAGFQWLTGISTEWSKTKPKTTGDEAAAIERQPRFLAIKNVSASDQLNLFENKDPISDKTVLAGRSIYYGALLYFGHLFGGLWLTVIVQALVLAIALRFALKTCSQPIWPTFAISAAIACLTPAPFFASLLMPDLFAGLTILACAIFIVAFSKQEKLERTFWFVLLTAALLFHTTHVLLAVVMLGLGVMAYFLRPRIVSMYGLYLIGGALALSYFGGAVFNFAVTRMIGEPPIRPPFLMARVIDDGPGYQYLLETCPENGFVICRFIDRLPLIANEFLWDDTSKGVFAATDPKTRRELSKEQLRFVFEVVKYDPIGQLQASITNAIRQALSMELETFEYHKAFSEAWAKKLPYDYWVTMQDSAAYLGRMPTKIFTWITYFSAAIGFVYVTYSLIKNWRSLRHNDDLSLWIAALVLVGALANVAICGALSGPHDRYQTRVIWLLPIMALLIRFSMDQRRPSERKPEKASSVYR